MYNRNTYSSMQNALTLQGHAPSAVSVRTLRSRALRTMDVRKMCVRTLALVRRAALPAAVISALATYAGVLVGSDPLTYTAAFTALAAAGIANSPGRRPEKGGAE